MKLQAPKSPKILANGGRDGTLSRPEPDGGLGRIVAARFGDYWQCLRSVVVAILRRAD